MSSTNPAKETSPQPGPGTRTSGADTSSAAESGGAFAAEEDIGTEGAGTEPPADADLETGKKPPGKSGGRGNPA